MKTFKMDMEVIINTVDLDKLPAYKRLLTEEYWKIPDDQFAPAMDVILNNVKNGELELIDIVKLYAYFNYFAKKGLIMYDTKTIKSVFLNGMNISSLKSKYCDNVEEELAKITVDGEMNEDMEEILKQFNELNLTLKEKMLREKAEEIFKYIPMKMEVFYEKFDKDCMNVPIFKYYDAYQIFQRISCASNEDIVTIKEKLVKRAEKYTKEIEPEMKNIKQLKQIMDDYIHGKDISIKIVMLKDFSKELGYILDKYKTPFLGRREE